MQGYARLERGGTLGGSLGDISWPIVFSSFSLHLEMYQRCALAEIVGRGLLLWLLCPMVMRD